MVLRGQWSQIYSEDPVGTVWDSLTWILLLVPEWLSAGGFAPLAVGRIIPWLNSGGGAEVVTLLIQWAMPKGGRL